MGRAWVKAVMSRPETVLFRHSVLARHFHLHQTLLEEDGDVGEWYLRWTWGSCRKEDSGRVNYGKSLVSEAEHDERGMVVIVGLANLCEMGMRNGERARSSGCG